MASNKAAQRRFNSSLSGAACKRGQFTCQECWISLVQSSKWQLFSKYTGQGCHFWRGNPKTPKLLNCLQSWTGLLQAVNHNLHFWNYPKIKISRYLLTDGSNPPIQQDPQPSSPTCIATTDTVAAGSKAPAAQSTSEPCSKKRRRIRSAWRNQIDPSWLVEICWHDLKKCYSTK